MSAVEQQLPKNPRSRASPNRDTADLDVIAASGLRTPNETWRSVPDLLVSEDGVGGGISPSAVRTRRYSVAGARASAARVDDEEHNCDDDDDRDADTDEPAGAARIVRSELFPVRRAHVNTSWGLNASEAH